MDNISNRYFAVTNLAFEDELRKVANEVLGAPSTDPLTDILDKYPQLAHKKAPAPSKKVVATTEKDACLKIASAPAKEASLNKGQIPNARNGPIPMRITTLLRKASEGKVFDGLRAQMHKQADMPQPGMQAQAPDQDPNAQPMVPSMPSATHQAPMVPHAAPKHKVTDTDARKALKQIETLENNKPGMGQLGRYASIGALAAPAISVVGDIIRGKPILGRTPGAATGQQMTEMLRNTLAAGTTGALSAGVIPLLRHRSDVNAEMDTLREFIAERQEQLRPQGMKVSSDQLEILRAGAQEFVDKLAMQTPRARLAIAQRNMVKPNEAGHGKGIGSIARVPGTGGNLPGANSPKQGI